MELELELEPGECGIDVVVVSLGTQWQPKLVGQLLQAGSICTRRGRICILQIRSDGAREGGTGKCEPGRGGGGGAGSVLARLTVHFAMQRAKLLPNNSSNNDDDDDDLFKPAARSFYQRLANLQRAPA